MVDCSHLILNMTIFPVYFFEHSGTFLERGSEEKLSRSGRLFSGRFFDNVSESINALVPVFLAPTQDPITKEIA